MATKLHAPENLIQPTYQRLQHMPKFHLLYANMEFGTAKGRRDARRLLQWLGFGQWEEARTLSYMQHYQRQFRDCLEWLANGSIVNLKDEFTDDSVWQELYGEWKQQRVLQFFQSHALEHGRIALWPKHHGGTSFHGLEIALMEARDPLDRLCWHVLMRLMVDGTVGVRKCKYARCPKFFEAKNERKLYCEDSCRANDFMSKKTPEEKAARMKAWRSNPMRRIRSRT